MILLALIIIGIGGQYFLFTYAAVFIVLVEFLQSHTVYRSIHQHGVYSTLFIAYLLFIVIDRSRHFHFSEGIEQVINVTEHCTFALTICLLILCYWHVFLPTWSLVKKVVTVVVLFNVMGVFNEVFQNWLK